MNNRRTRERSFPANLLSVETVEDIALISIDVVDVKNRYQKTVKP